MYHTPVSGEIVFVGSAIRGCTVPGRGKPVQVGASLLKWRCCRALQPVNTPKQIMEEEEEKAERLEKGKRAVA